MSSARILGKPDLFWLHQAESSRFKVRATDKFVFHLKYVQTQAVAPL